MIEPNVLGGGLASVAVLPWGMARASDSFLLPPDISFSLTIPVFTWTGITVVLAFLAIFFLYWIIKSIVTVIQGG